MWKRDIGAGISRRLKLCLHETKLRVPYISDLRLKIRKDSVTGGVHSERRRIRATGLGAQGKTDKKESCSCKGFVLEIFLRKDLSRGLETGIGERITRTSPGSR